MEPFIVLTSKNKGFANNSNLLTGNNSYFCCPASCLRIVSKTCTCFVIIVIFVAPQALVRHPFYVTDRAKP